MRVSVSVCPKCGKEFKRKVESADDNHNYSFVSTPEYCGACWAIVRHSPERRLLEAIYGGGRDM